MAIGSRWSGRRAALMAALVVIASHLPEASHAASRVCRQLEAELASGGARTTSRKTETAIARQQQQLQLAMRQARQTGCGFRILGGGSNSCRAINQKIDRMQGNLDTLERRRSRSMHSGRSRSEIMAAIRANGCRDDATAERRLPRGLDATRNLLDQIFGGGIRQRGSIDGLGEPAGRFDEDRHVRRVPQPLKGGWVNDGGRIRFAAPPGRYRTLCVRTCDGYHFPMSGSSTPQDFERDQSNCQSSCPGTEVQLYYARPGQESDAMVSGMSGQPYADLPTAWLYKQTGVPSPADCTCSAPRNEEAKGYSIIAGNPPAESRPVASEPVTPYPSGRPDPASDPETQANLEGGLDAAALRRMAVAPKTGKSGLPPPEDRKIRVVGPVFLPDREEVADPQAPAPTEVR
jgi:hypothetical protein